MALSQGIKQRVIGLCTGTIEPVTDWEDELVSAYVAQVAPTTPIVRHWYEYAMQVRADAESAAEDATRERDDSQYAHSALRAALERRASRGDVPLLRTEIAQLREVIDHQRQHIVALMRRINDLESLKSPVPVIEATLEPDEIGVICPICHGDGGVRGGCFKCGGTGLVR